MEWAKTTAGEKTLWEAVGDHWRYQLVPTDAGWKVMQLGRKCLCLEEGPALSLDAAKAYCEGVEKAGSKPHGDEKVFSEGAGFDDTEWFEAIEKAAPLILLLGAALGVRHYRREDWERKRGEPRRRRHRRKERTH